MFNSISRIIINSAIIITPLLVISQAQADDENVYDSSACVATSGTPSPVSYTHLTLPTIYSV